MSSIFDSLYQQADMRHITPKSDLIDQGLDVNSDIGDSCLIIFSYNIFKKAIALIAKQRHPYKWIFKTTEFAVFESSFNKEKFCVHFPSYGSPRIANSLEQLSTLGIKNVYAIGLAGGIQNFLNINDVILLEGSLRGDGVSRYYVPLEFPAIADFVMLSNMKSRLDRLKEKYFIGLSFGTDAFYRESIVLVNTLKELGVLSIDMETSALFSVSRKLGLKSCWVGVISDLLVNGKHKGTAHSETVENKLLQLTQYVIDEIESSSTI
jgi:uridine phosphorylase